MIENIDNDEFQRNETEKDDTIKLKSSLQKLLASVDEIELENNDTKTYSGSYIHTLLDKAMVSYFYGKNRGVNQ